MFLKVSDDVISALGGFVAGMYPSDLVLCGYEQVLPHFLPDAGKMAHVQTTVQV